MYTNKPYTAAAGRSSPHSLQVYRLIQNQTNQSLSWGLSNQVHRVCMRPLSHFSLTVTLTILTSLSLIKWYYTELDNLIVLITPSFTVYPLLSRQEISFHFRLKGPYTRAEINDTKLLPKVIPQLSCHTDKVVRRWLRD